MKLLKSKRLWKIVGVLVTMLVSYYIGASGAEVVMNEDKVTYDQLLKKIDEAKTELQETKSEIKKEDDRLEERKKEVEEALALADKKNSLVAEVDKVQKELNAKKGELDSIDSQIKDKQAELDKLVNTVQTKQEEPKVLSAGEYVVGTDVPAGRYKAVPVGDGSNFIVYGASSGMADVNTILGRFGESEYIFFTEDGDVIETHAKVKLIPVE
jgi:hypothetical protein